MVKADFFLSTLTYKGMKMIPHFKNENSDHSVFHTLFAYLFQIQADISMSLESSCRALTHHEYRRRAKVSASISEEDRQQYIYCEN